MGKWNLGCLWEPTDAGYMPTMTTGDCKSAVGKVVAPVINCAKFVFALSVEVQTEEVELWWGV